MHSQDTASGPVALAFPAREDHRALWQSPAAWTSFIVGFLTPYTVSVGGEMPISEGLLLITLAWTLACTSFNQASASPLFKERFFWILIIAQFVALGGYIFSDLYRQSFPHDMARGWSRMGFLVIDIVAIAYLFGRSARNVLIFTCGQCLGASISAFVFGALFDDMWKFGIGAPVTFMLFWLAPLICGSLGAVAAACGLGIAHFVLGYRSMGGLCLLTGLLTILQSMSPGQSRRWLAIIGLFATAVATPWMHIHDLPGPQGEERATRSNVERAAMATAAIEAIEKSPLIGYGSWFSNTDVYDNFAQIRRIAAQEAKVGGFPEAYNDPGTTALHSQILVALAEGGLFGGAFFVVFGASLLRSLYKLVFVEHWRTIVPLYIILLLSALWNLLFSPFSGAQRVYIATACGIMLLHHANILLPARPEVVNDVSV